MDRERLKEVHQTDLTESRVNEDFVDWLKNKGPTWLLVVLAAVCVYLAVVRYKQHKITKVNEGWAAYFMAELPGAYEDVARDFPNVGELANAARLGAADQLMRSVQTGLALGAADPTTGLPTNDDLLSPEERTQFLTRADGLFDAVLGSDDGSSGLTLFAVRAMNGKAAVAEARQDLPGAGAWYAKAATRAESQYPGLAEQARRRGETTPGLEVALTFRAAAEIGEERPAAPRRDPVSVDPTLRDLIMPDESGG